MKYIKSFNESLNPWKGYEKKEKIRELVKSNPNMVIDMINSGELDPSSYNNIILRASIKYKKNNIAKFILQKIKLTSNQKVSMIGLCYEHDNIEAVDLIMKYQDVSNTDIKNAMEWVRHIIGKDDIQKDYDIEDMKMRIK